MSGTLEKQYVVSRAPHTAEGTLIEEMKPWKVFDSRATARAFCKAKVAKSDNWTYAIDPVTRGPRA